MAATAQKSATNQKRTSNRAASRRARAAAQPAPKVDDIVMFTGRDGSTLGPGRLCDLIGNKFACVIFGDNVGCVRVEAARLSPAPAGSTAPPCDECPNC